MEWQFQKTGIPCLRTVKREVQSQEQTQELRISDGMPDIGSIIGAWGQPILRSKEWQSDGIRISGGTMVWVQYLPEEGGQPECVEAWIPFQMQWTFPPTQHDGQILAQCLLKSVDARSTSARKMMLRAAVTVLAEALEPTQEELFAPPELPEDIQLRKNTYPILLPAEAGEKPFQIEEVLPPVPSGPPMEKLLHYQLQPVITEDKIMGDKAVFRGKALLHMLYRAEDGGQYSHDVELPFSQFAELDREYEQDACISIWPSVTALEAEKAQEGVSVKAGIVCQYRVCHRPLIQVVEDAYSPRRTLKLQTKNLELPGILESAKQTVPVKLTVPMEGMRSADIQFLPQPPSIRSDSEGVNMDLSGQFQMLYYDMDGAMQHRTQKWEENRMIPMGEDSMMTAQVWPDRSAQASMLPGSATMDAGMQLTADTIMQTGIPMVTGLEAGEMREPDPNRPSLILRRAEGGSLWDLAKETGSTEKAIRDANRLQQEPELGQMLLIPVV